MCPCVLDSGATPTSFRWASRAGSIGAGTPYCAMELRHGVVSTLSLEWEVFEGKPSIQDHNDPSQQLTTQWALRQNRHFSPRSFTGPSPEPSSPSSVPRLQRGNRLVRLRQLRLQPPHHATQHVLHVAQSTAPWATCWRWPPRGSEEDKGGTTPCCQRSIRVIRVICTA